MLACVDVEPGAVMVPGSRGGSGAGSTFAADRDVSSFTTARCRDMCAVSFVVNDIPSACVVSTPVVAVVASVRRMSTVAS